VRGVEVSAKDLIAIVIVVCATIALCLRALTVEQYSIILSVILGYYFGFAHGYAVGRKASTKEVKG
jgi:hydrogenase/urease accessory protein HupE